MIAALVARWQKTPLHWQKFVLVALPFAALLLSATMALIGNYQRAWTENALARHTEVTAQLQATMNLTTDAETGLRGYLLTRRTEFAAPYDIARRDLPGALQGLQTILEQEPGEDVRARKMIHVKRIEGLANEELRLFAELRASAPDSPALYPLLARSKKAMDALRIELSALYDEDRRLLNERMQDIRRVRNRDYIAIFITLALGLASRLLSSYLFDTGVARRIERLTENVRAYRRGQPPPNAPTGRPDSIGALEQEIASLTPKERPADD